MLWPLRKKNFFELWWRRKNVPTAIKLEVEGLFSVKKNLSAKSKRINLTKLCWKLIIFASSLQVAQKYCSNWKETVARGERAFKLQQMITSTRPDNVSNQYPHAAHLLLLNLWMVHLLNLIYGWSIYYYLIYEWSIYY